MQECGESCECLPGGMGPEHGPVGDDTFGWNNYSLPSSLVAVPTFGSDVLAWSHSDDFPPGQLLKGQKLLHQSAVPGEEDRFQLVQKVK